MHETIVFLHNSPVAPLQVLLAGAYEAPQGKHFSPHQHSTWEVVYYRAGHIVCPLGDEVYEARPGMVLATPPYTMHAERATTGYANWYIHVEAPAEHPWPRVCVDDAERSLGAVCATIVREWRSRSRDREEMLTLSLRQFDILLRRMQEREYVSAAEQRVREAEQLMNTRFAMPLSVGRIAREVGVSPSSLRLHFARLRGQTPHEYLQAVRIQYALELLRDSDNTLETIAALCGFHSASHLSRYVKRVTGKSPGAYRLSPTDLSLMAAAGRCTVG